MEFAKKNGAWGCDHAQALPCFRTGPRADPELGTLSVYPPPRKLAPEFFVSFSHPQEWRKMVHPDQPDVPPGARENSETGSGEVTHSPALECDDEETRPRDEPKWQAYSYSLLKAIFD
jgi:hypothetical protein